MGRMAGHVTAPVEWRALAALEQALLACAFSNHAAASRRSGDILCEQPLNPACISAWIITKLEGCPHGTWISRMPLPDAGLVSC